MTPKRPPMNPDGSPLPLSILFDFLENPKPSFEDERLAFIEAARAHTERPRPSPLSQWIRHKFENGPPPEKIRAPWEGVSCWRATPPLHLTD